MFRFTFVVLHYITLEETIECVESILKKVNYKYFNIVIVDNGSPNNSGSALYKKYNDHEKVFVELNEDNLGFARGHNIGYKVAKYKLGSDFIILLNNDTIIKQEEFIEKIIEKYNSQQFDILGPDIISLVDYSHQNPVRQNGLTLTELKRNTVYYSFLLLINYLRIEDLLRKTKHFLFGERNIIEIPHNIDQSNVQLHGSCLIFSPRYLERFEGLCSKTFMFMEEDILFYKSKVLNLSVLYSPDIVIYHKEDSSTNAIFNKDYKKRRFYYKNYLKSSKVLICMMNEDE